MKAKIIIMATMALLSAELLTSRSSLSEPPPPVGSARVTYTKGAPGGVILQTVKTTATFIAIDQAKHQATLLGNDGKRFTVRVGPNGANFDQIRVGDRVTATITERIVASVDQKSAVSDDGMAAGAAQTSKDSEPSGLVAENTQRTATVIALDVEKRVATMKFDDGPTVTLPIRNDVDLSRRRVGERVVFRITQVVVIAVEKLP